jgi:hypothetical protein
MSLICSVLLPIEFPVVRQTDETNWRWCWRWNSIKMASLLLRSGDSIGVGLCNNGIKMTLPS